LVRIVGALLFPKRYLIFYGLFVILLFTPSIFAYQYAKTNNYFTQKEVVEKHFKDNQEQNIVITDEIERNLAEYHLRFDTTHTRFIAFENASPGVFRKTANVFVLLNGYTRYQANPDFNSLPGYAKGPPPDAEKLYDYKDVILYKLDSLDFEE
jgi:hypothetical protein